MIMADKQALANLKQTTEKFKQLNSNMEKITRPGLGEESLVKDFKPRLEQIQGLFDFANKYASFVHNDYVNQLNNVLNNIGNYMAAQINLNSSEYIVQKSAFLQNIDNCLEESKRVQPFFVTGAIMERGFLEDEGIRQEYQKTVENLRTEASNTLATVKQEAENAIKGAKVLADEIEARARKTATRISVEEAQRQFTEASKDLSIQVKLWTWLAALGFFLLISVPVVFLIWWPLMEKADWHVTLYHTLLRLLILSAVAAFCAFCLRMVRAYRHMAEKNKHRVRVANSVESFVNSALEPQQRDLILAKLVEAIVDFGESGLIKHDKDDIQSGSMSGEFVGRILNCISRSK